MCIFLCVTVFFAQAQDSDSATIKKNLNKAKEEMELMFHGETPDYIKAGKLLEPIVAQDPGNAEAWYFFGYAIDQYNMSAGANMLNASLPLAIRASEAFQNCIELSDGKYKGEKLLFDPYTKILTIWGTQALKYLQKDKKDSAIWCLNQAAIRGGINQTTLGYFRQVLQECSQNSYLFTYGDMYLYYIVYLQLVEKFRPDINYIDLNLLNADWSFPLLVKSKIIPDSIATKINYPDNVKKWEDQNVTVPNYNQDAIGGDSSVSWIVNPNTKGGLTRSSVILLNLLKENAFRQDVFFVTDVPSKASLNLTINNYLQLRGLTFKMVADTAKSNLNFLESRLKRLNTIPVEDTTFKNNQDNIQVLNNYRFAYTAAAVMASNQGDSTLALELLDLCIRKYPERTLPFFANQTREWFYQLVDRAEKKQPLKW
ncbi:hypothetical protein [Rhizosphaericola mali]|uniref:Tetratricopeptide repeat protein n=1 Tax=Rhizosphaericola mali TaxID=2545455 RepID=A0A5P2G9L2_9BACT|nr:hypothetical protein [Rhizosphaericola mali]QES89893.1 hypothetical protein E0W69_014915 [Rhizosphaericola mali]